jgi:hypothetical protein
VGRELSAIGLSVTRNVADDHPFLEELVLPFGPLRVYLVAESAGVRLRPRLDLAAAVTAGVFAFRDKAHIDFGASLSAGALVMHSNASTRFADHGAGVILLGEPGPGSNNYSYWYLFAHERVHVLQQDQLFLQIGEPIERWGCDIANENLHGACRWFDLNTTSVLTWLGGQWTPHRKRPWEQEAYFLSDPLGPPWDAGR